MKKRGDYWSPENRSRQPKHVVNDMSGTICRVGELANKPKKLDSKENYFNNYYHH
jgi:hypothetical protein